MTRRPLRVIALLAPLVAAGSARAQGLDRLRGAPLHYEEPATAGLVERVAQRLASGELAWEFDERAGYLPALLDALEIPVASQVLVFSRTSFQNDRISPQTPRAVYFGDRAYVGSIPGSPIVEVTSMDPERGPVFYTLEQSAERAPRFVRRDDECLQCHASSRTRDWPGHLVRSVHPDASGRPILRSGSLQVNHATPFEERWGGWYVTGTHGDARHRGNAIADAETERVDPEAGANVTELARYFDTSRYLSGHSDLVALMVFEHQTEMHNRLARASYEARLALHREEASNRIFGDPPGTRREATERVLGAQAERVLEYLLFEDEILLPAPIRGTTGFAEAFAARGRRDAQGRSLRDLDLERRLFRHPCSYVIHDPAFDALPPRLLEVVYRELWARLADEPAPGARSARLDADARRAVREILQATKAGLPDYWRP